MLAVVKQSYLPYLLLAMIGSFMEGMSFSLINGFYVTHILKVCTYLRMYIHNFVCLNPLHKYVCDWACNNHHVSTK